MKYQYQVCLRIQGESTAVDVYKNCKDEQQARLVIQELAAVITRATIIKDNSAIGTISFYKDDNGALVEGAYPMPSSLRAFKD